MLTVVKTRGSEHDRGSHRITVGKGGLRLGGRIGEPPPPSPEKAKKKRLLGLKRGRRK
jgi:circadian clock protein KaiC